MVETSGEKPYEERGSLFFSGVTYAKLDGKNRFVLPQAIRYKLVENGELTFPIALGPGGGLVIYRKSDVARIVRRFQTKEYVATYRKFFTLFFSTLHYLVCDKLGRAVMPSVLKGIADIRDEIAICGVLGKVEIWPRKRYEGDVAVVCEGRDETFNRMSEEVFALLDREEPPLSPSDAPPVGEGGD